MTMPAATGVQPPYTVVMLRHGCSQYNENGRIAGWFDTDLSHRGVTEAVTAGRIMKDNNFTFDVAYTSLLQRAIKTLYHVQNALGLHWIPVRKNWRLNERSYGDLQGRLVAEVVDEVGPDQLRTWRRSWDTPPPPMEESDDRWTGNDVRYKRVPKHLIPNTESLRDISKRVLPYWCDVIVPDILAGRKVLLCCHNNTIRALIKYLDNISNGDIENISLPTATPLVYELDDKLKPIRHYYLSSGTDS